MEIDVRLIRPSNGRTYIVGWDAVPNAAGFIFVVTDAAGKTQRSSTLDGKRTQVTVGAQYVKIEVTALSVLGQGSYSTDEPPAPDPKLTVNKDGVLKWDSTPGATSYELATIAADGFTTYRELGLVLTVKPVAQPGKKVSYDIAARTPSNPPKWYGRVDYTWAGTPVPPDPDPDPDPDPNPDPTPGPLPAGSLGLIIGSSNDTSKGLTFHPKLIREDTINQAKVKWANDNNILFIGLATNKNTAQTMELVKQYPGIKVWELDNEPYYAGVNLPNAARMWMETAKQIKAYDPKILVILPVYVQSDGGDYLVDGKWTPWVLAINTATNGEIWKYIDAVASHPYSSPRNAPPQFAVSEKVRGQLAGIKVDVPWYPTEWGWSVGTGGDQVTLAQQEQFLRTFVAEARSRPWIAAMVCYCMLSWGTGFEPSFGIDGRPAGAAFKELV